MATRYALTFLANDRYLEWAKVFLESVRSRDATLPLYCIPHGGPMAEIVGLRRAFGFEILEDGIGRLDEFALRLLPGRAAARYRGNLRKYAALTLPMDEVAYLDADILMTVEPRRLFGHIRPGEVDFVYLASSPNWVYAADKLSQAASLFPGMRLMSAGAFVTSRASLSIDQLIAAVEDDDHLYRSLRHPKVFDQPMINFALHRLGKACRHISELDAGNAGMVWAGHPALRVSDGHVSSTRQSGDVAAVHWAGGKLGNAVRLGMLNRRLWPLQRLRRSVQADAERRIRLSQSGSSTNA